MVAVYVTDRAGNRLSDLPAANAGNVRLELAGPGQVGIGVGLDDLREFTLSDNREIQIWRDGDTAPIFAGPVWVPNKSLGARALAVTVLGVESYLARRYVNSTLTFTATDQFDIAWQVIQHTQGQAGGGLSISPAAYSPSGVTRDRTYHGYDRGNIGEIVDAFRKIVDGFDWSIVPVAADRREWTPYYPSRGSLHAEWAVGFGAGTRGNANDYAATFDRASVSRRHHLLGKGDGPGRVIGTYSHPNLAAGTADLVESVSSENSVETQATATAHAQAQVEARAAIADGHIATLTQLEVTGPTSLIADVRPGDRLPCRVDDGWVQIDGTYRVTAVDWPATFDRVTLDVQPA